MMASVVPRKNLGVLDRDKKIIRDKKILLVSLTIQMIKPGWIQ